MCGGQTVSWCGSNVQNILVITNLLKKHSNVNLSFCTWPKVITELLSLNHQPMGQYPWLESMDIFWACSRIFDCVMNFRSPSKPSGRQQVSDHVREGSPSVVVSWRPARQDRNAIRDKPSRSGPAEHGSVDRFLLRVDPWKVKRFRVRTCHPRPSRQHGRSN